MPALALLRLRAADASDTYLAVRTGDVPDLLLDAIGRFDRAETLPWDTLPGVGPPCAAACPWQPRSARILGTAAGGQWLTWNPPVPAPPVPA
jgi:hypothetical protein